MLKLIRGGTTVTAAGPTPSDVLIEDERIAAIGPQIAAPSAEVEDAAGLWVLPGGVDVHTHLELPVSGTRSSDDFYTGQRAAAYGGTTTHIDFAIQPVGECLRDGIALWQRRAADKACIDYGFHANISVFRDDLLGELPGLVADGITSIKMLMAYKGSVMVDDAALFKTFRACAESGMLPMVHCENGEVIDILQRDAVKRGLTAPEYHVLTRPPACESEATHRAVSLARIAGTPLYVVHVTCAGALDMLRYGREHGATVFSETCPHYLFFTARDLARSGFDGAKFICSPPFRTAVDHEALWDALVSGPLDAVSTDHCPFYFDGTAPGAIPGKELGRADFRKVPNGVAGIEERLLLLWHHGVNGGRISPDRFVELTATNPARLFGLYPRKGVLATGSDADIVLWDPNRERRLGTGASHSQTDYSLYEGWTVRGAPSKVFLRGKLLVDGERWLGAPGTGRFLPRGGYVLPMRPRE